MEYDINLFLFLVITISYLAKLSKYKSSLILDYAIFSNGPFIVSPHTYRARSIHLKYVAIFYGSLSLNLKRQGINV